VEAVGEIGRLGEVFGRGNRDSGIGAGHEVLGNFEKEILA